MSACVFVIYICLRRKKMGVSLFVSSISTSLSTSDLKQMFETMCPSLEYIELGIGVHDELMVVVRVPTKEMVNKPPPKYHQQSITTPIPYNKIPGGE